MLLNRFFSKDLVERVFKIAFPMIVTELAHSIYSLTDTFFVSGLGTEALAGIGLAGYLFWIFMVFTVLFNSGLMIYVAQAHGAGERVKARRGIGEVIIYGIIFSTLIGLTGYIVSFNILVFLNGELNNVVYNAYMYFKWRVLSLPLVTVTASIDSVLVAIGWTSKTMKSNLTGVVVNMVLDPLFIYGYYGFPRMGVEGAAIATVLSNTIVCIINTHYLLRSGYNPLFNTKPSVLLKILDLSIPIAIERSIFSIGNNIYVAIIARCGSVALAAHNIGLRIESLIYMPGFAFSMAASALVGQGVGSSNLEYAKNIGREVVKIGTLFMTILGVIVAVFSHIFVSPFSPAEDVRRLASIYLILAGLSEAGLSLAMICSGIIRGAGNTRIPLLISASSFYLVRIIPSSILVQFIGVIGAWIGMFMDVYARGFTLYIVFEKYFNKLARRVV